MYLNNLFGIKIFSEATNLQPKKYFMKVINFRAVIFACKFDANFRAL